MSTDKNADKNLHEEEASNLRKTTSRWGFVGTGT